MLFCVGLFIELCACDVAKRLPRSALAGVVGGCFMRELRGHLCQDMEI